MDFIGSENGFNFRIKKEGKNRFYVFIVEEGYIISEFISYGSKKTLSKVYSIIKKDKKA